MCSLVLQGHQKRGSAINVPLSVLSIVWFYERTLYGDFFVKRNFSRCVFLDFLKVRGAVNRVTSLSSHNLAFGRFSPGSEP